MNFFITLLIVGLFQLTVLSFASNPPKLSMKKQIKNYKNESERISKITNETEQFNSFEKLLKRIAPFNISLKDDPETKDIIVTLEKNQKYQNLMEKRVKDRLNFELEEIKKNQTEKFFPEFLKVFEFYYKIMTGPLNFSKFVLIDKDKTSAFLKNITIQETNKLMEEKLPTNYSSLTCDENKDELSNVLKSISEFQKQFNIIGKIQLVLAFKDSKDKLRKEAPIFVDYIDSLKERMNQIYYLNRKYISIWDFWSFLIEYKWTMDEHLEEIIRKYDLKKYVEKYKKGNFCEPIPVETSPEEPSVKPPTEEPSEDKETSKKVPKPTSGALKVFTFSIIIGVLLQFFGFLIQ